MISQRRMDELEIEAEARAMRIMEKWRIAFFGERLEYAEPLPEDDMGLIEGMPVPEVSYGG